MKVVMLMVVTYTNFRGDLYYLHEKITKKGNTSYHFAKKSTECTVESLPDGYEIYEDPNGKVFLRKILKKVIHENEIKAIQSAMNNVCLIQDFKLDIKRETIYIYTVSNALEKIEQRFPLVNSVNLDEYKNYETLLRFTLVDEKTRFFIVERFSFLSGIEDWIELDGSENLQKLAEEYVQHLGQESFYELFE
ncbi:hypothetical protein UACE39S_00319 [Ureibacillus acetophenoni]